MQDGSGPSGVAAQLARMPEVVARLLTEHVPDRSGRCRGCGLPGIGSPYVRSPCGLWLVAEAAHRIAWPGKPRPDRPCDGCPGTPKRGV